MNVTGEPASTTWLMVKAARRADWVLVAKGAESVGFKLLPGASGISTQQH